MPRYLKVRGKPGVLVEGVDVPQLAHAHTAPRPYVGQAMRPNAHEIKEHAERYEPREQVVLDDAEHHLRRAAKDGDLELLGECVASDLAEATKKLSPPDTPEAVAERAQAKAAAARAEHEAATKAAAAATAELEAKAKAADAAEKDASRATAKAKADADAKARVEAEKKKQAAGAAEKAPEPARKD